MLHGKVLLYQFHTSEAEINDGLIIRLIMLCTYVYLRLLHVGRFEFNSIHADLLFMPALKNSAHFFNSNVSEECCMERCGVGLNKDLISHECAGSYAQLNSAQKQTNNSQVGLFGIELYMHHNFYNDYRIKFYV